MCLLKLGVMNEPEKQPHPCIPLFHTIDVVVPYIETIFEMGVIGKACTNIRLREARVISDKIGVVNYETTILDFPYFSYRTIQGTTHNLIFKNMEVATKARELMLQSIDNFYKNYSQYVTSLN